MSKSDRYKAEISFHEKMFFASLAVSLSLSLLAWSFKHYSSINLWVMIFTFIGFLGSVGFGVWNFKHIKNLLEDLENVE